MSREYLAKTYELHHHYMRQITPVMPPLVGIIFSPLSLIYILFISLLVWFFVGLGLGRSRDWVFFYDDKDLVIFIWV